MRKFLLAAIFAAGVSAPAWGWSWGAVEIGFGTTQGSPGHYHGRFRDLGPQGYAEGRLNIGSSWDVGLQLMGGTAKSRDDGYETWRLLGTIYGDYNFYRDWNTRMYVGLGLGAGYVHDGMLSLYYGDRYYVDEWGNEYDDWGVYNQLIFNPRVGVELWGRLNLSVDWKLMSRGQYSTLGLNIGFVL